MAEANESGRTTRDLEIVVMTDISRALAKLDGPTLARVLEWVNKKYGSPTD